MRTLRETSGQELTEPAAGGVVALGHPSALRLSEILKPALLVSHHDEDDKRAVGLVSVVLKRRKASHEAVRSELQARGLDTKLRCVAVGETLDLAGRTREFAQVV